MTTASDPRRSSALLDTATVVNYDEPPYKTPPALVVGPLAWVRDNLLSSPFNIALTIVSGILLIVLPISFFGWVVGQANWFVINFNLRQFMVGRYEVDAEWRVALVVLMVAFTIGALLAAFSYVSRRLPILVGIVVALCFIVPLAINTVLPLPPTYLAAGDADIVSGSSTQPPVPNLGFVARTGETVRLRIAEDLSADDPTLTTLHGFGDIGANLLRASAAGRLTNEARIVEIDALFAADLPNARILTDNQRAVLETERGRLAVTPPITESTALNTRSIRWRLLDATLEPIGSGTLAPGDPFASVTLPADGWYILEKTGAGTALLETYGIYPLIERNFTRSEVRDESGVVTQQAERYNEYLRMTDSWITRAIRPEIDGDPVPMTIIIDTQYRGDRSLNDYLRVYLAPFLEATNDALLWIVIAAVFGFGVARLADRVIPSPVKALKPRAVSQRMGIYLLVALPVLMFVFIYGIGIGGVLPITDTRRWGGLLLTIMLSMVGIIASFPLGVLLALGRRSKLPVVSAASTIYIEFVRGVPLIAVLFMAQLLVPLISPTLAEVDNVFRAMVGIILFSAAYLAENVRGGLQAIPPGQEEAAKALGLAGWQVTVFVTLPQALRLVIPALVGQFISLLKDTSLVAIVGMVDLTGIAQSTVAQTEFLGTRREVYIFITIIYFVFCYVMAAISRRLEASGSGAARRV
ncbi:MAG: amino acid ABC transporter permease [Chloroflexota bacterium]|nr:amino acid ABC transporter permease [Chloroflexota bacterium]